MKLRRAPNKGMIHLSFYAEDGQLRTEYIPTENGRAGSWLKTRYILLLIKFNRQIYYWNFRYILPVITRKAEDLRFIDHVVTEHDGVPTNRLEKFHFKKAWINYQSEYQILARHIFDTQREKETVIHPYAKAYIKMWKLNRHPQWRMMYHGVNIAEYVELTERLDEEMDRHYKNRMKSIRRANKLLKKSK